MNHSLLSADRGTHAKIVAIALIGAIIVVAVGIMGRIADTSTATARVDGPILKAGAPATYTSSEASAVR